MKRKYCTMISSIFYKQSNKREQTSMQYAILGDLHSSTADTKAVLAHIARVAPQATIIGLGDLYECKIGKKKASTLRNLSFSEAAESSPEFEKLLTFPSVYGNQEERITLITNTSRFTHLLREIYIDNAVIIHGHQFTWDANWQTTFPKFKHNLLFFGHSHQAGLYTKKGKPKKIRAFNTPLSVEGKKRAINVGAVVGTREWCLYDSSNATIAFMRPH